MNGNSEEVDPRISEIIVKVVPNNVLGGGMSSRLFQRIREDLGFDKIPVQLELKASRQKWEDRER